jgi:hypothetical protein
VHEDPNEDREPEHEGAEREHEGEPLGSQYTSQDEDQPMNGYEEFDGYEPPQNEWDGDEAQFYGLRVEEDYSPEINGHTASLKTIDPDMDPDMVSRSSMRRVMGQMSRPIRRPKDIQCLTGYVDINGVSAYAMFDTGSTTDAVSTDFSRVAHMPLYTLEKPMTLKLGCVGSKSKINFGTKAKTSFAGKTTVTYYDVANIDKYDAILGLPYMNENGIVLDVPAQLIRRGSIAVPSLPLGEERTEPRRQKLPRFTQSQSR